VQTTGIVSHALGTASAPTVTFTGDTNTGIYSPGADQVAISTNGTGRLTVSTTAVSSTLAVDHPLGAVGTPSITFTGDLNTGFWSPTADTIAVSTGGSERLRIDSSGRLGLGTSTPGAALDVVGGTAGSLNAPAVFIENNKFLTWKNTTGTWAAGAYATSGNDFLLAAANNLTFGSGSSATERVRIDSSGRVGIGTTSPDTALSVQGAAGSTQLTLTDATNATVRLGTPAASVGLLSVGSGQSLAFGTQSTPGSTYTERARIDSSGRLLVGTSSSSNVNIATFQGNSSLSTGTGIVNIALGNTSPGTTDQLGRLQFTDSGHNSAAEIVGQRDSGTWNTSTSRPTRLVFSTTADGASSPTERMRITNNGAICVGGLTGTVGTFAWISSIARSSSYAAYQARLFDTTTASVFENYNSSGTFVGGITASNTATSFPTSSDARLKINIQDANNATSILDRIRVVSHEWKDDDSTVDFGVIAQELYPVAPQAVTAGDDNEEIERVWSVDYSKLVPILVKALQESNERIETLEAEVAALKAS
jgi:hypothetical protein